MKAIGWLDTHVAEYMRYISGHGEESPFDLPHDLEGCICLQENDYLRLSSEPCVREAQIRAARDHGHAKLSSAVFVGKGGESALLCERIAESMKCDQAVLTTAGWTANVGLLESITPPGMPIYMDSLAHASLWDGAGLSRGKIIPVGHNQPAHLERRVRRFGPGVVVVDAFYSSDGSVAELPDIVDICERFGCVLVLDEAHSFGMLGERGGGLAVNLGLHDQVPYRTGSLSKALGGHGGFVAGPRRLIEYLRFRCRSTIFSSSPSEVVSAGNRAALEVIMKDPSRARQCLAMAAILRKAFTERHISIGPSRTQIVSVHFRGCYTASRLYWALRNEGILMSVFAPPAAPRNRSFARFSVHARATVEDMHRTADTTARCIDAMGFRELMIGAADPGSDAPDRPAPGPAFHNTPIRWSEEPVPQ